MSRIRAVQPRWRGVVAAVAVAVALTGCAPRLYESERAELASEGRLVQPVPAIPPGFDACGAAKSLREAEVRVRAADDAKVVGELARLEEAGTRLADGLPDLRLEIEQLLDYDRLVELRQATDEEKMSAAGANQRLDAFWRERCAPKR